MLCRRVAAWFVLAVTAAGMPGCLVVAGSQTVYGQSGEPVSESTLSEIEPGKTTKDWLVGVMGQPTSKADLSEGGEIYIYEYVQTKHDSAVIFLLLSANNKVQQRKKVFFEIKDGVVQKYWRETHSS